MLKNLKPSQDIKDKITLYLNHLLVIYAFLIPIDSHAKSQVLAVMLILFVYRGDFIFYLKSSISNKIVQSFVFVYGLWVIGLLYTDDINQAINGMYKAKYLLLPLFILSFIDKNFSFKIITAFIVGMLFSELVSYGIGFHILPSSLSIYSHEIYKTSVMDPSPFFNHIDYSIGLALTISLLLYQLLNKNINLIMKIITIIFILSATINMGFIGGRTGYVNLIILTILVFVISNKKSLFKSIFTSLGIVFLVSVVAYNYSSVIHNRTHQTINSIEKIINNEDYSTSVGVRIGLSRYALEALKDNLIFGVGSGDDMNMLKKRIPKKYENLKSYGEIHNVYVQTLLQFGLVGLFILFLLFYRIFRYEDVNEYRKGILIIITTVIMISMLPGKFYGHFVLPMFVVIVSAMIANQDRGFINTEMNKKSLLIYFFLTFVFITMGLVL